MTYALLIYRTAPASIRIPALDDARALQAHRALQAETSAAGELHAVARLDEPTTAQTVALRATSHAVTDGPFIESKEWLVGFYVLDCVDEAQALDRARQLADAHHVIEVRPVNWSRRT